MIYCAWNYFPGWSEMTTGHFVRHVFSGGHFYFMNNQDNEKQLVDIIKQTFPKTWKPCIWEKKMNRKSKRTTVPRCIPWFFTLLMNVFVLSLNRRSSSCRVNKLACIWHFWQLWGLLFEGVLIIKTSTDFVQFLSFLCKLK